MTDPIEGKGVSRRTAAVTMVVAAVATLAVTVAMCAGWLTIGVAGEWTWDRRPSGRWSELPVAGAAFGLYLAAVLAIARGLGRPSRPRRGEDALLVAVLALLGMGLQLAVGQLARGGLHEWPALVAVPWTNGYFDVAVDVTDMRAFLRDYHRHMARLNFHCRTHPPGPVVLYWSINRVLESWPALTQWLREWLAGSAFDPSALLDALRRGMGRSLTPAQTVGAWAGSMVMAWVCVLGCVPVFFMGRQLWDRRAGLWAAAVYLVSPCVLYFTPALDQVVAAACALGGWFWVCALACEARAGRAAWWAFASGVAMGAALFLSISAGAFGAMLAAWWLIELLRRRWEWRRFTAAAVGGCAGVAAFYLVVYALSGHQCVATFGNILSVARENVRQGYIQRAVAFTYRRWLWWNLVEFFLCVGLAATVCFVASCWRRSGWWSLPAAFAFTLLALDVSGTSMSETGRLWMPLACVPVLWAGAFVSRSAWVGGALVALSFGQAVALKLWFGWM